MQQVNSTPIPLGALTTSVKRGLSSSYLKDGEIPVRLLKAKDIDEDGRIAVDDVDEHTVKKTPALDKARVKAGDLVISLKGKTFKTAQVPPEVEDFVISSNLIALTFNEKVRPEIVAFYLKSTAGEYELQKRAAGSAVMSLNTNQLMDVKIPLPPIEKQREISRYLGEIEELKSILTKEKKLVDTISDHLLNYFVEADVNE